VESIGILVGQPVLALQLVADGIFLGAVFVLPAYGMALVWGVMNVINVAQGEFVILGGYIALLTARAGLSPFLGIPAAAAALFAVGLLVYLAVVRHVVDRDLFSSLLATFGVSILLAQLCNELFGADVQSIDSGLGTLQLLHGALTLARIKLVTLALALGLGALLILFLKRARLGQAIRATAQNARAARIVGIDTGRVFAMTYALNAAICGAAGALVVMTWVIHPYLGLTYTIRSFMIVILGGLGSLGGAIVAGLGLGVAENLASFLFGAETQGAFLYTLLVVLLIARSLLLARRRQVLR
jgi:branched-chain amino acid transport system permease protein